MNTPTNSPAQNRAALEAMRVAGLGQLPDRFAQLRAALASGLRS